MVLGLRSKNRRHSSIQVDYTIHIQDIKPWPPSQSLKSVKSVVFQWENAPRNSGSTSIVTPGQSKIEFNESFNLHVTLVKDSSKGNEYQKNMLELSLYEPRRDKRLKGQLLGNAVIDLAEYGVIKEIVKVAVPLNCKRSYRNTALPVVYVKIQALDKEKSSSASSSFREDSLSKESVSALMSEEYLEEEEIASFTDDDVSSHSSLGNLVSSSEANTNLGAQSSQEHHIHLEILQNSQELHVHLENEPAVKNENKGSTNLTSEPMLLKPELEQMTIEPYYDDTRIDDAPQSLPGELSIYAESTDNGDDSSSKSQIEHKFHEEENIVTESKKGDDIDNQIDILKSLSTVDPEINTDDKRSEENRDDFDSGTGTNNADDILVEESVEIKQKESGHEEKIDTESASSSPDNNSIISHESSEFCPIVRHKYIQNALRKTNSELTLTSDRVKTMRFPMRSPPHSLGSLKYASSDQYVEDVKEIDSLRGINNIKVPNKKVQELEGQIVILERELREAAAIEISLYSIVAEHGSSMHKVHTPARRLSRLYVHASKVESKATAARSIASGLVSVAKACGNDVPRLTFWLSNSMVLRTIITQAAGHLDTPNKIGTRFVAIGSGSMAKGKSPPLKWESFAHKKEKPNFTKKLNDWDDLSSFTYALERIESWIFSRIIESIWWQTLTPHMQSSNGSGESNKGSTKKNIGRQPSLGDKNHANFSTDIWKNAFSDACERLCPVRADGHECGCLPILAKLVMEQCVARLDIAMFNAILRESDEEMPTDPVSDPISDAKVLPIQPGKLSFGAGAQLKNAIGNWSRWLTDLFGMDMDESPQSNNEQDDERFDVVETFKSFCLLNALSDLLMLPKDMLFEKSIRKEVCPIFSALMIKRILESYSPDEFCPDAIPDEVLEALESEDSNERTEEEIQEYPCSAPQISYLAPSVFSIETIIGNVRTTKALKRSGSSVIRKCHTSDDELDELDSPLASIILDNSSSPNSQLKSKSNVKIFRYRLLRDVWKIDD